MTQLELKDAIKQYLNGHVLMIFAVANDANDIWICNLFYIIDEDLNFYMLTGLNTIHGKLMMQTRTVAINVVDSNQDYSSSKKAVQLKGEWTRVKDEAKIKWFLERFSVATNNTKAYDVSELLSSQDRGVFKVNPTIIKFLNQELFPEKGVMILDSIAD